ncbi:DUF1295 domain-containing protein [Acinetobacter pittii]|uniref:DUF1295 domain-containing protein n=1 Tax=Acinetobacter pittii TaxID=48296 RepID=UPI0021CD4D81|nr:DUF1295 domain-containing protein [Acinetobacter pittii]MCU4707464.1 DUF1295 domain-containing protein [Acinetobacter pittii]
MFWNLLILDLMIMLLSWLLATLNGRAGIVDAAWSFCLAVNIIVSSLLISVAPVEVRLFIGIFSGLWFLRLFWHLLRRYQTEQKEDGRYASMRKAMGKFQHIGFLFFFIFQTLLVLLFFLPMWMLLNVETTEWSSGYKVALVIAAVIMAIAFIGEQLADQQLYRFKLNPDHHGKTMDQGLWRYSRHPNYFFEWLHWFAYPIIGLAAGQYVLWIYPLLMWLFLYYVTGIPFSEKQAIKSRGQNYLDYQQKTSMFIPRKPKK